MTFKFDAKGYIKEPTRASVAVLYQAWTEAGRLSSMRRVAFGGATDAMERLKAGFAANRITMFDSDDVAVWEAFSRFDEQVKEDDLIQVMSVATDCAERRLVDQVPRVVFKRWNGVLRKLMFQ